MPESPHPGPQMRTTTLCFMVAGFGFWNACAVDPQAKGAAEQTTTEPDEVEPDEPVYEELEVRWDGPVHEEVRAVRRVPVEIDGLTVTYEESTLLTFEPGPDGPGGCGVDVWLTLEAFGVEKRVKLQQHPGNDGLHDRVRGRNFTVHLLEAPNDSAVQLLVTGAGSQGLLHAMGCARSR